MNHTCPTGHHARPSYVCYASHGCRCDECTELKVARNRYDRWNGQPPQQGPTWLEQLQAAERVRELSAEVDRLRSQVRQLEERSNVTVVRHEVVQCDCDAWEELPDTFDARPLVELVEGRGRPVAHVLPDESLQRLFYRGRQTGTFTLDAADRLAVALGHTIETIWPQNYEGAA